MSTEALKRPLSEGEHRIVYFDIKGDVGIKHNYMLNDKGQGSHSDWKTWKTWKNGKAFSSQGKVREF